MREIDAVLEFGTSKIICMISANKGRGRNVPSASCVRYDGIADGHWVAPNALDAAVVSAVETAEDKCKKQVRALTIGIPGCFTKLRLSNSELAPAAARFSEADVKELRAEARPEEIPGYVLADSKITYYYDERYEIYVDPPIGLAARRVGVCMSNFYVCTEFLNAVEPAVNAMRIAIDGYVFEAQAEAMTYIPQNVRDKSALLLDVGFRDTNLCAVYADTLMAIRTIHLGGNDLTSELSNHFEVDSALAESLKRAHIYGLMPEPGATVYGKSSNGRMSGFDANEVRNVIEKRSAEMLQVISGKIKLFEEIVLKSAPIYLTGAGLAMRGAEQFVSARLGRKTVGAYQPSGMFPPVYNTALCILDNGDRSIYDLTDNLALKRR